MRHSHLQLAPRVLGAFYGVFGVLFGTGLAWWIADRAAASAEDLSPVAKAWATWLLKLHGAAAMLALVILGVLYPLHISRGWRLRRNRFWGAVLVSMAGILVLTGYLLYYVAAEHVRALAGSVHLWLGLAFPVLVLVHIRRGRAGRPR